MSAQLYFSNSPAVLLDKLSGNLDWSDPFQSPRIATPTPAMKRWVQMRLAEKRGIVANVEFLQLERTLWRRLEELDLEHVVSFRKPARLLDEKNLQLLILALLRCDPPPQAREYLDAGEGDSLHARRVYQLSAKLAGFFREYEYSRVRENGRMGVAYLWKRGEDCFRDYLDKGAAKALRSQVEHLEQWQKSIYHALFRPGGIRDRQGEATGQYLYTLPQYAEMVLAQVRPEAGPEPAPPGYHLFGLSQISPFHRSLVRRLSDAGSLRGHHCRFFIYSLNPCAEYWEDALDRHERRRIQQEDLFRRRKYVEWHQLDAGEKAKLALEIEKIQAEELHLAEENPILSQWGRPGRENVQLWNQVPDYDFFSHFQEPAVNGLLGIVQESILKRRGRLEPRERKAQDGTLQILACPEIHREVETVRQAIIEDMLEDPTLRPDEIAVLVPDMSEYRHVLAAVFGRTAEGDPGHVPFSFADTSVSAESDYARAVRGLFELARGRFSRKELFALAANPCFRRGLGLDEEALKIWGRWAERLNIFHGFDGADRKSRGYPDDASHSWSQGLERLLLGTVMESPAGDDPRHFAGMVPFADGGSPDRETLQAFVFAVEGLHRALAPLRGGGRKAWGEWLDLFDRLWDDFLQAPEDEPLEAFVQADLRRYLQELRGMDALEALLGKPDMVTSEIPMDLVLGRLEGMKAGRDSNFTGGVNIASLLALRSLPFRVVCILGLGEGKFPEDAGSSTLDLRQYRRVIGDVDPAARNRYLFLEALVGASDKLRLSYVCRDLQRGSVFQMSSVLNELVDYLQEGILPETAEGPGRFRLVNVPLHSRSPVLFGAGPRLPWDPPRNHDREDRLLAWLGGKEKAWLDGAGIGSRLPRDFAAYLRKALAPALKREVFPPSPVEAPVLSANPAVQSSAPSAASEAGSPADSGKPVERLLLDDLRWYLDNPAQSTLRRHLGIRDYRDDGSTDLEDEPFSCPPACERELLARAVRDRLADWINPHPDSGMRGFSSLYDDFSRRGLMPAGHYRSLDKELQEAKAASALEALDATLAALREGRAELKAGLDIGDGDGRSAHGKGLSFPPVRIGLSGGRLVELHGHLPNLFVLPGGEGCATLIAMSGDRRIGSFLSPFLFYLAGLQSDSELGAWLRSGKFSVQCVHRAGRKFASWKWAPFDLSPPSALRCLQDILESLLAGPDFDLLPFGAIADCLVEGRGMYRLLADADYAGILRDKLEEDGENEEFAAWRPTETLRLLDARVPDDAYAKIQSRLGLFFNWTRE